ncbi:hypothetical protein CCO32_14025 [Salmonella enterica subsp. enterica serovar Tees]|nr:hypothetical protein [Salmonella enterica subsp. enterica serovar Tees]EDV2953815.1 hypothetical protein [Salmonella enterica subsp. enterica]OZU34939.1 hypothetical protein CCO32_14025 [Salmonella enterica subsp. enterica serovar Tees]HAF1572353.1 hypothetical protein [Salmonella enterica]
MLEYCCLKAAIQRCYLKAIIIAWYHIVYVMIGIVLQLLLIISRNAFFLTANRCVNPFHL